jgi:hypothetical protein
VSFDPAVGASAKVVLGAPMPPVNPAPNGRLAIDGALPGGGAAQVVTADASTRLAGFVTSAGAALALSNLLLVGITLGATGTGSRVEARGCVFNGDNRPAGKALTVLGPGTSLYAKGCHFYNHTAFNSATPDVDTNGAAVLASGGASVEVRGCVFTGNKAVFFANKGNGGAMAIHNIAGPVLIDGATFTSGGATAGGFLSVKCATLGDQLLGCLPASCRGCLAPLACPAATAAGRGGRRRGAPGFGACGRTMLSTGPRRKSALAPAALPPAAQGRQHGCRR